MALDAKILGPDLIAFDAGVSSDRFRLLQSVGTSEVAVTRCLLSPNGDGHIAFAKTMVAIHEASSLTMEWRPPESDRVRSTRIGRGEAMLADAAVPVWKRWLTPRSIFAFAIADSFVEKIWRDAYGGVGHRGIRTAIGLDDPILKNFCALGRRELTTGGVGGRLYLDGLATALTVYLLRTHGTSRHAVMPHKGGLAPIQLRRVLAYIAAHLEDEITLSDLAAVAELSTHHFGAAFKVATGQPPHRFVMDRRIDRARELLRDRTRPIAEIAYAVGFCSQAHLTQNFRRVVGITPRRFRCSLG